MIYILVAVALPALAVLAVMRKWETRWPREGHGVTYFARPTVRW
jgi:hypothetical protein